MSTERLAGKIRESKGTKNKRDYITEEKAFPIQQGPIEGFYVEDENIQERLKIFSVSGFLCYYRIARDPDAPHDPRIYIHTNINAKEDLTEALKKAVVSPFVAQFNEPVYAQPAYYDENGNLVMQVWHLDETHPGVYEKFKNSPVYSELSDLLSEISRYNPR